MRIKLKKVRTKCMVKGCRNSGNKVATFNVSASHEFGKGVIMCAECIRDTCAALEEVHNRITPRSAEPTTPLTQESLEEAVDRAPEKPQKRRTAKSEA